MSIILSMMVKVSIHHASFSIFHSFSVTLNKYLKKTTFMSLYCYCDPSKKWWKTKEIQHFVWRNFINKHRSTFRLCISLTKSRNRVFRSQTQNEKRKTRRVRAKNAQDAEVKVSYCFHNLFVHLRPCQWPTKFEIEKNILFMVPILNMTSKW